MQIIDVGNKKKNQYRSIINHYLNQHRAVKVANFYHRGGNGPTTAGGVIYIYIYIYNSEMQK